MSREYLRNYRVNLLAAPLFMAGSILFNACGTSGQEKPSDSNNDNKVDMDNSDKINLADYLNPNGILDYPFPEDYYSKIKVQTGWYYNDGTPHNGIDFANGEIDQSNTWESFPVIAPADGKACIPPQRQGNAVLIRLNEKLKTTKFAGQDIDTYMGHLWTFMDRLPSCSSPLNTWINVTRGQKIGEAGATGVIWDGQEQPTWIHLHFQLNVGNNHPDPYDIYATREKYPSLYPPNDNTCGPEAFWKYCLMPGTQVKKFATPITTTTPTTTPVPTRTPTATGEIPRPEQIPPEVWNQLTTEQQQLVLKAKPELQAAGAQELAERNAARRQQEDKIRKDEVAQKKPKRQRRRQLGQQNTNLIKKLIRIK